MGLKRKGGGLLAGLVLVLAGCDGVTTAPTDVTANSATLTAQVNCAGNASGNPCLGWFQWWADGPNPVIQSSRSTPSGPTSSAASDVTITRTVTGLSPGQLYRYQVCGSGDTNIPASSPLCTGPFGTQVNAPGKTPADMGDFDAFQTFRTGTGTTRGTSDLGRLLTTADTASTRISRDGGVSAQYAPGKSLWVFGDTGINGATFPMSVSGTAAIGTFTPGKAPRTLTEVPTPPAAPSTGLTRPQPFFARPAGLVTPTGAACASEAGVPVSWIGGAAAIPGTQRVLLTYGELCLVTGGDWLVERQVLIEYDPATNTFPAKRVPFQSSPLGSRLPLGQGVGSPVFGGDGYLYLFAADLAGAYVARVPAADRNGWGDAANYRWWAQPPGQPTGWYPWAQASPLKSVLPAGVAPRQIDVNGYAATGSKRLAMVVQTELYTAPFTVYTAASPTGPWTAATASRVPDPCVGGTFACYAVIGHPELSSDSQFVYSWYSPDDRGGEGHIRIGAVPW